MATRLYQAASITPHTTMRLDENASHHLARVLRANINDPVTLFNGTGGEYTATIAHIDKKGVTVTVNNFICRDAESPIDIFLAQGIARGEKMDFIIQKSVELGAKKIFPLITERCNVRLESERAAKRMQHWQSVIISAAEQSGRCVLPELLAPQSVTAWLATIQADLRFVLSPHVAKKLPAHDTASHPSIAVLIGPEGGLSDHEIVLATNHDFQPLNLGPRILRTETATIATLSALQMQYGDFA